MLFKQIEYFQSVVESGNFYLAAEKCCISQSAISQQIKKLEEMYDEIRRAFYDDDDDDLY